MHLRTCDSTMKGLIDEFEEPPLRSHGRLFETLARAIVGQQISAKAADAVWGRLLELIKTAEPSCVLEQTPEALRSVGLSGRKVEYIQSLAERADWQPTRSTMSDKDVIKQLALVESDHGQRR